MIPRTREDGAEWLRNHVWTHAADEMSDERVADALLALIAAAQAEERAEVVERACKACDEYADLAEDHADSDDYAFAADECKRRIRRALAPPPQPAKDARTDPSSARTSSPARGSGETGTIPQPATPRCHQHGEGCPTMRVLAESLAQLARPIPTRRAR